MIVTSCLICLYFIVPPQEQERQTERKKMRFLPALLLVLCVVCVYTTNAWAASTKIKKLASAASPNPNSIEAFLTGQSELMAQSMPTPSSTSSSNVPSESGEDVSLLETIAHAGHGNRHRNPGDPLLTRYADGKLTPFPDAHLRGPDAEPHNNISPAIGVSSSAIPWMYRQYMGQLNTHRRAEPIIYSPMLIAKSDSGTGTDVTELANARRFVQQLRAQPGQLQLLPANHFTVAGLTLGQQLQLSGVLHQGEKGNPGAGTWFPKPPEGSPFIERPWKDHLLDLYAPTPPPLLAPVPPMGPEELEARASGYKGPWPPADAPSFIETAAAQKPQALFSPERFERVQPLITDMGHFQQREGFMAPVFLEEGVTLEEAHLHLDNLDMDDAVKQQHEEEEQLEEEEAEME